MHTFPASASQTASQHIKNPGTGSYRQNDGGGQEDEKTVRVKHERILWIGTTRVNEALLRRLG
jgi:hypothetical protein